VQFFFFYKLITKVLAKMLKKIFPCIIFQNQSAFIPRRLIFDNILVAYMALKLDMSKVYGTVEWDFFGSNDEEAWVCREVDTVDYDLH
jgi:hypothetical protein